MGAAVCEYLVSWVQRDKAARARWMGRSLSFTFIWTWCALLARTDVFPVSVVGVLGIAGADIPLLASNVLALIILIAACWRMASLLDSQIAMTTTAVFLTASSLTVVLGQAYQNPLLCYLGVFLGGAAIATLKISWGEMYSRMRLDEGLIILGVALIVSAMLIFISLALPTVLVEMIFVACGVLCVPFLRFGTLQKDYVITEVQHVNRQRLRASWTFLALPILVALTFGASYGTTDIETGQFAEFGALISPVATCLSGFLLIIVAIRYENRVRPAQIYAWALIMVVAGFVLLALGVALPAASTILVTGFLLFYFFMIVFWGNLAKRMGRSVVVAYLVGYTAFQVAQLAGDLLSLHILSNLSFQQTIAFVLGTILLFFACVLLVYGSVNSPFRVWLMADSSQETSDDISDACALISRKYRLTPREHEILAFLARGRNASHIVSMQNISYETAKTHIKNIRRKLNVHSQQEIIDLIDKAIIEGVET
jgi:DNA-binding CsgD family transcriptional regulator